MKAASDTFAKAIELLDFKTIHYQMYEGVACITLSRPEQLNAFSVQMADEMIAAIQDAAARDEVRSLMFTGDGRVYCAGADFNDPASNFLSQQRADFTAQEARDHAGRLVLELYGFPKPVIGLINGAAVGVGATMTLPMDVRIASPEAKFGFVFSRRGICPEGCSTWFLPRIVGISRALQWCYSGEMVSADEAKVAGLVNDIVDGHLLDYGVSLAHKLTDRSSAISMAVSRQMMWRMMSASHPMEAHRIESRALLEMGSMPDAREGVAAFLEKREAEFGCRVSRDMPAIYPWWQEPEFGQQ